MGTRACLAVADGRQWILGAASRCPRAVKMFDAIFYAVLCAVTYGLVALLAECRTLPHKHRVEFVRYDCEEGHYNPVASLLLTTSEGAVKRLFSRRNVNEIHWLNEVLAFAAYSTLNICLTGIPVPSGNFTGSMLIGGLAGRIMGAVVRDYNLGPGGSAASGVYAMVGSAAMLCGFKQMAVAVVVFISGCANDLNLVPPLMLSVTVSLLLNKVINERSFDEEQILRKGIPFLMAEPPAAIENCLASQLVDTIPDAAVLPPEGSVQCVREALRVLEVSDFPVLRDRFCVGFTTRARLQAALQSHEASLTSATGVPDDQAQDNSEEHVTQMISNVIGRASGRDGMALLPISRLAERPPYTVLEDMPVPRLYALFAKAGARAVAVVSANGEFRGMITRAGLINAARQQHKVMIRGGSYDDDDDEDERSSLVQGLVGVKVDGGGDAAAVREGGSREQ